VPGSQRGYSSVSRPARGHRQRLLHAQDAVVEVGGVDRQLQRARPGLVARATGAQAQETFKVGIVSFLSGQAAESFGIPAVNGAKVLLDAFNKGAAPAPYNKVGFGGMKLEFVYVDENGGATKQVQELKQPVRPRKGRCGGGLRRLGRLPGRGPGGRGDEEVPDPLRLRHAAHLRRRQVPVRVPHRLACGDGQRRAGRYLKAKNIKVESFNMINQDYAWGQDSKKDFTWTMEKLYPTPRSARTSCPSSAPASTAPRSRR
jgi:branched-chain amino acid transport system substrate-binding protein